MSKYNTNRDAFYDVVKGIGICFVLLGHSIVPETYLHRLIWYFHMPLFFVVAGCFYRHAKIPNIKELLRSSFISYIIPLVVLGAIQWLMLVPFGYRYHALWKGYGEPFRKIWIGEYPWNGAVWFLFCLMLTRIAYWLVMSLTRGKKWLFWVSLGSMFCVGVALAKQPLLLKQTLPFKICSVPLALCYYAFGNLFAAQLKDFVSAGCARAFIIFILGTMGLVLCALYPYRMSLGIPQYPHIAIDLCGSFAGIVAAFALAKLLVDVDCVCGGGLSYVGRNSLAFFTLEKAYKAYYTKLLSIMNVHLEYGSMLYVMGVFLFVMSLSSAISPCALRLIGSVKRLACSDLR